MTRADAAAADYRHRGVTHCAGSAVVALSVTAVPPAPAVGLTKATGRGVNDLLLRDLQTSCR
jgi:hypothetical protein